MVMYNWIFNNTKGAIERDMEVIKQLDSGKTIEEVAQYFNTTKENILGATTRYTNGELAPKVE